MPAGQWTASTVEEGIVEQGIKEEYHTCPQLYHVMVRAEHVGAVHYMKPLGKG